MIIPSKKSRKNSKRKISPRRSRSSKRKYPIKKTTTYYKKFNKKFINQNMSGKGRLQITFNRFIDHISDMISEIRGILAVKKQLTEAISLEIQKLRSFIRRQRISETDMEDTIHVWREIMYGYEDLLASSQRLVPGIRNELPNEGRIPINLLPEDLSQEYKEEYKEDYPRYMKNMYNFIPFDVPFPYQQIKPKRYTRKMSEGMKQHYTRTKPGKRTNKWATRENALEQNLRACMNEVQQKNKIIEELRMRELVYMMSTL